MEKKDCGCAQQLLKGAIKRFLSNNTNLLDEDEYFSEEEVETLLGLDDAGVALNMFVAAGLLEVTNRGVSRDDFRGFYRTHGADLERIRNEAILEALSEQEAA